MKVFHDHDEDESWTEITNIIAFPKIIPRLDQIGTCTVIIRDFEGALYATWKDYDFIPMKVEDDSSNVLFRGYLTGKKFKHNQLVLTISGLGIMLEWKAFSNNYVLSEGKVSNIVADELYLTDFDGNNFSWGLDSWHSGEQNKGILLVDNTTTTISKSWDASAVACTGGAAQTGDHTDTITKNDGANFLRYREDDPAYNAQISFTIDGDGIPDSMYLQRIEIDYQWGMLLDVNVGNSIRGTMNFLIRADPGGEVNWYYLRTLYRHYWTIGEYREWIDNPTIVIEGTHAELVAYFNKTGANYTSLKGLKIECSGSRVDAANKMYWEVDYIQVRVYYNTQNISPVMKKITDNGATWIRGQDVANWTHLGVAVGDSFKIGENVARIINDLSSVIGIEIHSQTTLSKYMARWFKGTNGLEVLKAVCNLEGTHWFEDYINDRIIISATANMVSSGVDLTQSNYDWDWQYEDNCNNYYKVEVFGSAALGIYAFAEDISVNSYMVKSIIDESIMTTPDAQEVADEQLAIWKVKKPSIKIPLNGVNSALTIGTTVGLTMVRPTVAAADYPIRMIERSKFGTTIKTVIYCGLGHSDIDELIGSVIRKSAYLAHKAHTDRLISTPLGEGAIITWDSIGGKTAGVENIITAEIAAGESIDNAIDALILAHKNNATAHQDAPALISTHNVADKHKAHSSITITAGTGLTGGGTIAANRTINCSITQFTAALARSALNNIIGSDGHLDADFDADQHKIVDLAGCTVDNDAARKKYVDDTFAAGGNASVATGSYTGNAANNRQITGLGFNPKYMIVLEDRGGGTCYTWFKSDTMTQWQDYRPVSRLIYGAGHIDLITDGFAVNNNDANDWLNISGLTYHWVAWG